jgi:hypothetical protein
MQGSAKKTLPVSAYRPDNAEEICERPELAAEDGCCAEFWGSAALVNTI